MTSVLVAGESWVSESTHYKGFDAFTSVTFHTGVDPLRDALSANGITVDHLPAHDVPACFPSSVDELGNYDVVILSDIGANSIVNTRAAVDHDCKIGETVHIAPGVTLSGNVRVGDRTHIGTGAVVIQGIFIGEDSLVAAGAVVCRDLPAKSRLIPGR